MSPKRHRLTRKGRARAWALGIDLGGSSVKAVGVTSSGDLLLRRTLSFDPEAARGWIDAVQQVHASLRCDLRHDPIAVGVSAPGLAAQDRRSIRFMPARLRGLEGLDWQTTLEYSRPVPVLNDAHAALMGERWCGAARGLQHVIMLTLGTGVGGAAIVDGHLLRGCSGKAGHLGHTCLNPFGSPDIVGTPGSLEDAVGNATIVQRSQGRFSSTHLLINAVRTQDPFAIDVWTRSVRRLACAIVSFTNILDPEAVIIGGGIARAGNLLLTPLRAQVREHEWQTHSNPVRILRAQLGQFAGAFGAAHEGLSSEAS